MTINQCLQNVAAFCSTLVEFTNLLLRCFATKFYLPLVPGIAGMSGLSWFHINYCRLSTFLYCSGSFRRSKAYNVASTLLTQKYRKMAYYTRKINDKVFENPTSQFSRQLTSHIILSRIS